MIKKFILLSFIGLVLCEPFHKQLTAEEYAEIFPMTDINEVPKYDIIPVHKSAIQKRAIDGWTHLHLNAFGKNIKLWLNPMDGVLASTNTPVYSISSQQGVRQWPNMMEKAINELFHDHASAATMHILREVNGNYHINGYSQAYGISIRSLPSKYQERARRSVTNEEFDEDTYYHIGLQLPETPAYIEQAEFKNPFHNTTRFRRDLRPDVVYPEIMVIIDYTLFQLMQFNAMRAVEYVLAYFNGVDLRYRTLESPKYRINIAGIVLPADPAAIWYLNYPTNDGKHLNVQRALEGSTEFLALLERNTRNFDAAIALTNKDLCESDDANNCINEGTNGFAHVGLQCQLYNNRKYASGMVEDKFGFEGVRVTAHELGHLLGVSHDGQEHNRNCDANGGTIMTPAVSLRKTNQEWSGCSVRDLERYLVTRNPQCLYNKPITGTALPTFLPGRLMNAHQQCAKIYGNGWYAQAINDQICYALSCANGRMFMVSSSAADGTECGPNKMCLSRQCYHMSEIARY